MGGIPELLVKLKDAPDFYVEMTWEFTSWVPLVSRQAVRFRFRFPLNKTSFIQSLPIEVGRLKML
jgi:hypothetical protein